MLIGHEFDWLPNPVDTYQWDKCKDGACQAFLRREYGKDRGDQMFNRVKALFNADARAKTHPRFTHAEVLREAANDRERACFILFGGIFFDADRT